MYFKRIINESSPQEQRCSQIIRAMNQHSATLVVHYVAREVDIYTVGKNDLFNRDSLQRLHAVNPTILLPAYNVGILTLVHARLPVAVAAWLRSGTAVGVEVDSSRHPVHPEEAAVREHNVDLAAAPLI